MRTLGIRKKNLISCLFIVLNIIPFVSQYTYADNTPVVVFRVDDCRDTWRNQYVGLGGLSGLEYGKSKKIPITWGLITDLEALNWGLSYTDLTNYMAAAGGEVASHSAAHSQMASDAEYISELEKSKFTIQQNISGYTCKTFLQPGVWVNDANMDSMTKLDNDIGKAIQADYAQSMAYLANGWQVGSNYYKYGIVPSSNIDYNSNITIQSVLSNLDMVASTPGIIYVIACHGVQEQGDTQNSNVQADLLKAVIDKLSELRDQGSIRIMSLNDAYHTNISSNLNRVVDPNFEFSKPELSPVIGSWLAKGTAAVNENNGFNNSRYAYIPPNGEILQILILPPGRYILKWKQRIEPNQNTGRDLKCYMSSKVYDTDIYSLLGLSIKNSTVNTWEDKSALILVPDKGLPTQLYFTSNSGMAFGIDNVSLIDAPLDASLSPTSTMLAPNPNGYSIQWRSPDDKTAEQIVIRYDVRSNPITPSDGTLLKIIPIQQSATQSFVNNSVNWNNQNYLYVSVFAIKQDGSYSDPDITFLKVDKLPPQMTTLNVAVNNDASISANWLAADSISGVYGYEYKIGTDQNKGDIQPWTFTTDTSITLSNIVNNSQAYISVRALNPYGFRSPSISQQIAQYSSIANVHKLADKSNIAITGNVSAIFGNCFYLEQANRMCGIKIIGKTNCSLGQQITVSGCLSTVNGERVILSN